MIAMSTDPVYFLLVDDLDENLLALEGLLRRDGLVLLKAQSGREALEMLLNYDVALALIDIQMPEMTGLELAELMRGTERTRRVPIIFLTAGTADRHRRFRGYEAGAVDFLQKPLETDVLRSKADVFFELYRQRQEVAAQRDELKSATEEITRLLKESRQYAAALKEADQRKDDFLAMLAHELRNPLAPVRNAVEILRLAGPTGPMIEQARDIISRQVNHIIRLVDDLLDVARISRSKIQLRMAACDLTEIIRQTSEDYRLILNESGIDLDLRIPEHPITVMGDAVRLAQVLGNLLHNACKFTPRGGRVSVCLETLPDDIASIKVIDTGMGLDKSVLSQLFQPFGQGNQGLDRSNGGLGLGLALVRGLIELHGGRVFAQSAGVGQGSTFTIQLPIAKEVDLDNNRSIDSSVLTERQGLKVLLIEDNEDTAITLQRLLALMGHEAIVAFTGQDGLTAARDFQPDVVISDLGLPGEIDGYVIANHLKADAGTKGIFLIALSGYGQDEDRRKAQNAGFDLHLVKPADLARLEAALATAPRRSR